MKKLALPDEAIVSMSSLYIVLALYLLAGEVHSEHMSRREHISLSQWGHLFATFTVVPDILFISRPIGHHAKPGG